MRSAMRLKYAVFQLTPTRTRCDLVIVANGKTEKIASGLVNPFLSHLKTAQDQISKGGYSIKLEPDPAAEAAWFTKDTVERFVRFVSTPEVLERVNTIESEILQIEQAILYQADDSLGLSTVEDHHHRKAKGSTIVSRSKVDVDGEKAIVIYKPGSHPDPPDSSGSKLENSKVQLLTVLESRKKVLQKEQAMAFARAAAAGFDSDNIADLISFAKSFGAMRLMDACICYMQLWKDKHETGQWIEVEAAEALSYRSEFSALNTPGINLSGDDTKPKEALKASSICGGDISMETKSNPGNLDNGRDKMISSETQVTNGQSECHQRQFQHPMFLQWPMHARPGPHAFQSYPLQVMPYYQNCPVNGQFFHPLAPPLQDPSFTHQRKGNKKHSRNSKDGASTPEVYHSTSEFEEEPSRRRNSLQKAGRFGMEKGAVVIRNLNYIAGRGHETLGNGFDSSPDSEFEEGKDSHSDKGERKHKPLGSSKRRDIHAKSLENSSVDGKDEQLHLQEADAGNWQAFQNFLLRVEEKMIDTTLDGGIFNGEKDSMVKKRQNKGKHDSKLLPRRDNGNSQEVIMEYDAVNCKGNRSKQLASADELLLSKDDSGHQDSHTDAHFTEIEGLRSGYKKSWDDDFLIHRQEKQMDSKMSSDPPVDYERGMNSEKSALHCITDESFLVPFRSDLQGQLGRDIVVTTDVDPEFPSAPKRNKDFFNGVKNRVGYEPHDLTLMPERTKDEESIGYDPAMDYGILAPLVIKKQTQEEYYAHSTTNEDLMKDDKEKKRKSANSELEKKRKDPMVRKMTSSRSMTLNEAQKKAQKPRNCKANVQKLKKEQEEEEIRRLETLKREREKRIAARSDAFSTRSSANLQQKKSRLPIKGSPTAYKSSKFMDFKLGSTLPLLNLPGHTGSNGFIDSNKANKTSRLDSKFTDSELGSNLPLPNMPRRTGSIGFVDSDKANKTSRSNKSSRSASLLPELKKDNEKQERSLHSARIRRLSEPKGTNFHSIPGNSAISHPSLKKKVALEPQSKKMSAIVQLDRTKSQSLPELKIKPHGNSSDPFQGKSAAKQKKGAGSRTLIYENTNTEKVADNATSLRYSDDNLVIEKTLLMLGNNVVPAQVQTLEGKMDEIKSYRQDTNRDSVGLETVYAAICAPPLPFDVGDIENTAEGNLDDRHNSYVHLNEIESDFSKDEPQKFSSPAVDEKTYLAPFARASSLDEPTIDSNSADQMNDALEKPRNRESKGFRKLWKFGRKNHTYDLGDGDHNSDRTVVDDDHTMATSSNDISTLKNFISQDETHTAGNPTKVFHPFSILSPFRKSNEKKVVA